MEMFYLIVWLAGNSSSSVVMPEKYTSEQCGKVKLEGMRTVCVPAPTVIPNPAITFFPKPTICTADGKNCQPADEYYTCRLHSNASR